MGSALRPALIALLLVGLLLPRMGAALSVIAPGAGWVVICRGDALVTVALGADGAPIGTEVAEPAPCLAAALPPVERPPGDWRRLARAIPGPAALRPGSLRGPEPDLDPYPKRGPPAAL